MTDFSIRAEAVRVAGAEPAPAVQSNQLEKLVSEADASKAPSLAAQNSAPSQAEPARREGVIPVIVVVMGLIAAIQIASFYLPSFVMPPPLTILWATIEILRSEYTHIGVTALRLLVSILFAMGVGILLGIVMGVFPKIRPYIRSLVIIDTGIPALSWMLLAIFWFPQPEVRIFFILSVILIPFYALSIFDGIRALPRDWVDMIESFRPRRWQVLRYLILPHIIPYILSTTKSVIGYAVRMVIFSELIASTIGIGSRMSLAQSMFRIDTVLGWTVILIVLNLLLQTALTALEKYLLKWRAEASVR
jgi:NitT/TauT family transport system permease protein